MKLPLSSHAGWLGLASSGLLAWGNWHYAQTLPNYDAARQTVSELAAFGTPLADQINYGLFLPVGLMQWLALVCQYRMLEQYPSLREGLLAFSWVGTAYVFCALFPCDPGSPLIGSWRQQIHNLFGALEYLGGGLALLLFGRIPGSRIAIPLKISGALVLTVLVSLAIPCLADYRGLIQRVAEGVLFGWLALASAVQLAEAYIGRIEITMRP
ncbi:DUF998 domain-containing protein [Methylomonas sp. MED-D]|uniref:DUF998 domain-containing protein n=1 Tax=Methylomonas koyamae TaxID=702114 RepID=A0A177N9N6_9GAMM|nr:DUF998 domain-containing protein [Methylomonas koyamae]NJA08098.1 DUF998 domain-containing protein [Methylococcaceae bacterium WWC4]OAI13929.1 hypothetical protein A1355_12890 [Methylomonas koyamae]